MSYQRKMKRGEVLETMYGQAEVTTVLRKKDNMVVLALKNWKLAQGQSPTIYMHKDSVQSLKKVDDDAEEDVQAVAAVDESDNKKNEEPSAFPKIDLKMPISLILMFYTRKIDWTEEGNIELARFSLITSASCVALIYFLVFLRIRMRKDKSTAIWVPPPEKPALPFQEPNPPPASKDYQATTYSDFESKKIQEAFGQLFMSCAIAGGMSWKFNIHVSLCMQTVLLPYSLWDLMVVRKNVGLAGLLSSEKNHYGELLERPEGAPAALQDKKND